MAVKRKNKLDTVFSYLVRERAEWKCEMCHQDFTASRSSLHCSHIISRIKWGVRFDPVNAAAHCNECHYKLGCNPLEMAKWARGHLGDIGYENLRRKGNEVFRTTKQIKADLYRNLKAEEKRVSALRADGVRGRLDFASPYDMVSYGGSA